MQYLCAPGMAAGELKGSVGVVTETDSQTAEDDSLNFSSDRHWSSKLLQTLY